MSNLFKTRVRPRLEKLQSAMGRVDFAGRVILKP
jgi:hypothetical protein